MANTQAICNSFKKELMLGIHALGTTVARASTNPDAIKAALYFATATINYDTTSYTSTGEVTGTNYSAGGVVVTNGVDPTNSNGVNGVGYWTPSAAIVYTNITISFNFDTVLLYNSSQGNKAIAVFTFSPQTVLAGNVTLNLPSNTDSTALIQLK